MQNVKTFLNLLTANQDPRTFVLTTPESSPSGDILTVTSNQLKSIDDQINSIDIVQSKLKPPEIDYNISF